MAKKKKAVKGINYVLIILAVFAFIFFVGTVVLFFDNQTERVVNYPEPSDYFFVEDFSGVLNEETESFIYNEAADLYGATGAQVVVVTVPDTQEESLEDFSNHLANNWGIGSKEEDNGVLILFETDEEDPHVRMEVGKGLEGAIPDGKAGRILDDNAVEDKNEGRWNRAAGNTFVAVAMEVYSEYGLDNPGTLSFSEDWYDGSSETTGTFADLDYPEAEYRTNDAPLIDQIVEAMLECLVLIIFFLIIFAIVAFFSLFGGIGGGGYSGGGGFSGGGHSGGGGFSGGGGSFGGGGASR